ncbi:putative MFS monocarboxylate transporter [Peniophora sp. CONT]|nr:putative MFS monocarboxylate transporter [Peniophora sp. CONT]
MSADDEKDISVHLESAERHDPDGLATSAQILLDDIPDGGTVAWLQVLGSYFIFMDTWGIVNSYGAFQRIYEDTLPNSPSTIAWIGSIQGFILLTVGCLSGPIFDRGYFHALVVPGAFATKYYQILLAQGVCMGIGMGLIYIPCIAVLASYFRRRRALALGFAAAGSGSGSVIFPAILYQLQPTVGLAWATRAIALIILVTLLHMLAIVRRRVVPVPSERRQLFDKTALRDVPYLLFTAALTLAFMGLYVPFFFISPYMSARSSASTALARYMVPILNAASIPGRIFPNIAADYIGCVNTMAPCVLACAILIFTWITIQGVGGLITFTMLYGFFTGTFVSVTNAALVNLTDDIKIVGTRLGMSFTCAGFGLLIDNPVAGALINLETVSFIRMQIFGGVLVIASAALFFAARFAKVGGALKAKI